MEMYLAVLMDPITNVLTLVPWKMKKIVLIRKLWMKELNLVGPLPYLYLSTTEDVWHCRLLSSTIWTQKRRNNGVGEMNILTIPLESGTP